jgi:hypothetical protein
MFRCALLLLLSPALILAACGGGSSGLTKAQYDAKVSRLCLVAADGFREMHVANTIGDYRHNAAAIVHIGKHFDEALAALKAPSSIAPAAAGFLGANTKVSTDEENAVAAARAGNAAAFLPALAQASRDSSAATRSAKAIGATGCYIS